MVDSRRSSNVLESTEVLNPAPLQVAISKKSLERRKSAIGILEFEALDQNTLNRIKKATKLDESEINERYEEFNKQFPDKGITPTDFRRLSSFVLEESEVNDFTRRVFKMFDTDHNKFLTFEEFTLATEQGKGNPLMKLAWLFDKVYDENASGYIDKEELHKILIRLLADECYTAKEAKEMISEVFEDLDLDHDNYISKREFLIASSQNETLQKILVTAANSEREKRKLPKLKKPTDELLDDTSEALAAASIATPAGSTPGSPGNEGKKKKKKKKKKRKKDPLDKYVNSPGGSRAASRAASPITFTRMSRRGSIF